MNIHIEHLTINVVVQPEHKPETVQEAPIRRGHRTQEEIQLKLESARLQQLALQKHAARLQHKLRIAEKLRRLYGVDVANSVMAGGF